jgi:hypothetical protein
LLAGWSIWVGIAVSARSSDVRAAQHLSVVANLPPVAINLDDQSVESIDRHGTFERSCRR